MPWNERTKRRLKLRDLEILTALIDTGSMGKAARRLNISQPARDQPDAFRYCSAQTQRRNLQ